MATTFYGIVLKVTPNTANPFRTDTVLYRAESVGGSKVEVARQRGTGTVWYYEDILPVSAGDYFYWARSEAGTYASSSYVGPVDAEPVDLGVEVE